MNITRISVISQNVLREMVRDRILFLIGFYAFILAIALYVLPKFAAASEDKMFLDFGLAVMQILGLIIAIFVGTGLINKEIEKRTLLVFLAKPMSRSEFIVGKFLGLCSVITTLVVAMTAIYIGFLQLGKIEYFPLSIIICSLFLCLQLFLIAAFAITFGVFTSSLLAAPLTLVVYLMGNITQEIFKLGQLAEQNPDFERLTKAIYLILPDFSRLDLKNDAVYGLAALPNTNTLISNAGYGLLYIGALLAIAILIFSRKEF
ncbi:ABC transporter permease [Calothrix sp. 336/3]|uniref:ABC transporter permease n=1 Tax=Calothrix sp. 336/3 TaxID=1337936 RepID=UPI0004E31BCC|nr:ABC transporter permease subunit [Calothrix sp. 336/3]AKG23375.1 multi-copper enzyme maturation ABC transporter permease [Calothrix sp. 336/3]